MHKLSRTRFRLKRGDTATVRGKPHVLGRRLGDGAAGVVFLAKDPDSNREVAIKVFSPDPNYVDEGNFDELAERFKREGERGLALEHPHLVKIRAFERNEDGKAFSRGRYRNPFIVLDYCPGGTIEDWIKSRRKEEKRRFLTTPDRLRCAVQLTDALEHLHRRRMIHRDVKPANAFLSSPSPRGERDARLGDFGIMKWSDINVALRTGTLTATNQRGLGTLKYMSSEQVLHPRDVTSKADIFSLGVLLYELFTSQILATPIHVNEIVHARLERGTTLSRFATLGVDISEADPAVTELVLDMHRRGPSERPATSLVHGTLRAALEND